MSSPVKRRALVLIEDGIYKDEETLFEEALRVLLETRPELKIEMALGLYKRGEVSLGKAAKLAGLSREEFKEVLASRGIARRIGVLSDEVIEANVGWVE